MAYLLGLLGLGILISVWFSWQELRFLVQGQVAEARVLDTYETQGRNGTNHFVKFGYKGGDGSRVEDTFRVSGDWEPPTSGRFQVQYIPGDKQSARPVGTHNYTAVSFLAICAAALAGGCIWLWLNARTGVRDLNRMDREEKADA